jgi:hypothetical protein
MGIYTSGKAHTSTQTMCVQEYIVNFECVFFMNIRSITKRTTDNDCFFFGLQIQVQEHFHQ